MWSKVKLYILSLWLLFLLLFASTVEFPISFDEDAVFIGIGPLLVSNIVPLISLLLMVLGAVFYFDFDYQIVKAAPQLPRKVLEVTNKNFETLSFLITYIIPFVCFVLDVQLDTSRNAAMFFLLLFVIGWIYVKTNIFYNNPTLALIGFRVYQVKCISADSTLAEIILIGKEQLRSGDDVELKEIDEEVFFARKVT